MIRAFLASAVAALALAACGQATPGHTAPDAFVPVADPTVGGLSPDHGPAAGGTTVTITGTGFADAGSAQVLVDGVIATGVTSTGDTALSFVAPPGEPGATVSITVFNQRGTVTMDGAYTYNPLPTVSAVSGPVPGVGGATVTINGTGFQANEAGDPTVTVGGKTAMGVQVKSDTQITFTAPPFSDPPVGSRDLVVDNANGTATLANGYHYTRPGLLMVGDSNYNGQQYELPLFYIDPMAASPVPIQISTIHNTYKIRGMAPRGPDVLAIYQNQFDGLVYLAQLDPFTGRLTDIAPITLNGNNQSLASHLVLQNGAYYLMNPRVVCCSTAQVYRIDIQTGVLTAVGATFTTPHRAFSMGPGLDPSQLNFYGYANQAAYAATTAGGAPVALGPALNGTSSVYPRGTAILGGTIYGITNADPTPGVANPYNSQALVAIDPANGTITAKAVFPRGGPNRGYRQAAPTPASW